ncbi:MAG: hypothetical protein M9947_15210 [Thermomicrobiales bacterium]|nr:hypothetical protein [Thermomicrobiales bacterium]
MYAFPQNAHARPEERVPRRATRVHDPITATTLVLQANGSIAAICAVDLCVIPEDAVSAIRTRVAELESSLATATILISASHTHHGPVVNLGEPWTDKMVEAIAISVVRAFASLQPAWMGASFGTAELTFNRRVVVDGQMTLMHSEPPTGADGPTDSTIGILRIDSVNREPIAVVVIYTAHPLIMGPKNLEFTADFPGRLRAYLEQSIGGGVQALFLNGAAGNIHPKLAMQMNWNEVDRMGVELGRATMPAYQFLRSAPEQGPSVSQPARFEVVQKTLSFPNRMDPSLATRIEIDVLRLGGVAIAFVPGEFFVEFQLQLRESSPAEQTYMVGYSNSSVGYVPTEQSYPWGGYGVEKHLGDPPEWSRTQVPEGAGEAVLACISEMINNLEWNESASEPSR